jgi:hypothetical protein
MLMVVMMVMIEMIVVMNGDISDDDVCDCVCC